MLTKPDWSAMTKDQKLEALKPILELEEISASQIALRFCNCTKSAISGFCRRENLKLPGALHDKERAKNKRREIQEFKKRERAAKAAMVMEKDPISFIVHSTTPIDPSAAIPFLTAIERRLCKWPLWDSNQSIGDCCGLPRAEKGPYCPEHLKMSIGEGTPSERRAHRELRRLA